MMPRSRKSGEPSFQHTEESVVSALKFAKEDRDHRRMSGSEDDEPNYAEIIHQLLHRDMMAELKRSRGDDS
jgi:hypothetical protein